MAETNYDRIGKTLNFLRDGLTPFVERELKNEYGDAWRDRVLEAFPNDRNAVDYLTENQPWDVHFLLKVIWDFWNSTFTKTLGRSERSQVSELRDFRNDWAHQKQFSTDDAYRCMDSSERLLNAVSASQAEDVAKEKNRLMREKYQQELRDERRKLKTVGLEGQPLATLKPWREIITPHEDVASGKFQQAEFAADLWQVYRGQAKDEYGHPVQFYKRTFMTDGLKILLKNTLARLTSGDGEPIVELQTNFGGGKTHSMLALFHMFSGTPFVELPGIEDIIKDSGVENTSFAVRRAVLVGTRISPGQPSKKEDGTIVHTLWGELAWQLGGKEGYEIIRQADETATNPGEALQTLIEQYSPCLILIDEWVAYARQLHDDGKLCGGSFETQFTFAQNLSETIKNVSQSMLVVSIPASDSPSPHYKERISDIEIGGERGVLAVHRLKNVIGRIESPWRPASQQESYEIVRRRLFNDLDDSTAFRARDSVIDAFMDMYGKQAQEFPSECREEEYRRRMAVCYPIHPELLDRLYSDWSSLEKFQRTRGVLRLMARVIHFLWSQDDKGLLIMPAAIPVGDSNVQSELTRYLENSWAPVIERDVDGPHAISKRLDADTPNLGRYVAAQRVARTIYMASAPTTKTAHRGADDRYIKLGCVQPGESVATFGDALRRLSDQAMHLYVDKSRYWFDTQPTVQRLARDRAEQYRNKPELALDEIKRRLAEEQKKRDQFARVHACPASSADVFDERETRLVILAPEDSYERNGHDSKAIILARDILENRGTVPRQYRNALVFIAADKSLMQALDEAVRLFLAWDSVVREKGADGLNLDANQARQAESQRRTADETVAHRIHETYCWLLSPGMTDAKSSTIEWSAFKLQGQDHLAQKAARRLDREQLFYTQMGAMTLRLEMDKVPLWRGDHVAIQTLVDDFAKYVYLPRLQSPKVLLDAIRDGVSSIHWEEGFAYAEHYDETQKKYVGLKIQTLVTIAENSLALLVKPEAVITLVDAEKAKAKEAEKKIAAASHIKQPGTTDGGTVPLKIDGRLESANPKRFYGSVRLDATRITRDVENIADEVIHHLQNQLGGRVEITLEISAEAPGGFDQDMVRTVTENCRTLKFEGMGFEEE